VLSAFCYCILLYLTKIHIIIIFFFFFRISILKDVYQEDLTVLVVVALKGDEPKTVFHSKVKSKKEYNSWFYVDFGDKVFVPKGAECIILVQSSNAYQLIPFAHIKENIEKVEKCAEFSYFQILFFEQEQEGEKKFRRQPLEKNADYFFSVKSLSVTPVDAQV